jgi:hypothetical protein
VHVRIGCGHDRPYLHGQPQGSDIPVATRKHWATSFATHTIRGEVASEMVGCGRQICESLLRIHTKRCRWWWGCLKGVTKNTDTGWAVGYFTGQKARARF